MPAVRYFGRKGGSRWNLFIERNVQVDSVLPADGRRPCAPQAE